MKAYAEKQSLTAQAAATLASVSIRGLRRPESARERATRSRLAWRASSETPPRASATFRNAFMRRRGSSSISLSGAGTGLPFDAPSGRPGTIVIPNGRGGWSLPFYLHEDPGADAGLDDEVGLIVKLPKGSSTGPVIDRTTLAQLGVRSAPQFRAYIAAHSVAWKPGITRRPHLRNRRFHMWSSDPANYTLLTRKDRRRLAFGVADTKHRTRAEEDAAWDDLPGVEIQPGRPRLRTVAGGGWSSPRRLGSPSATRSTRPVPPLPEPVDFPKPQSGLVSLGPSWTSWDLLRTARGPEWPLQTP